MARWKKETRETVIDGNGEKTVRETATRFSKDTRSFVYMFTDDVTRVLGLKQSQTDLLKVMTANMDYRNVVRITSPDRKEWSEMLGIGRQTLNLALSELMKRGLVLRKGQGHYVVDPELFNKGTLKDIDEKIRTFNAHFHVKYEMKNDGIKRTVKILRDDVKEDDEEDVY